MKLNMYSIFVLNHVYCIYGICTAVSFVHFVLLKDCDLGTLCTYSSAYNERYKTETDTVRHSLKGVCQFLLTFSL